MNKYEMRDGMDDELIAALELLEDIPERDEERVKEGRRLFLAEIQELQMKQVKGGRVARERKHISEWGTVFRHLWQPNFAISLILAVVMAVAFLFGGVVFTTSAAQNALPGDALYSLKTSMERTKVKLSSDPQVRTELYLSFAAKRLDEIQRLITEKRYADLSTAAQEYEYSLLQIIASLDTIRQKDPSAADALSLRVMQMLLEYAHILNAAINQIPAAERPTLERMLLLTNHPDSAGKEVILYTLEGVVESVESGVWVISGKVFAMTKFSKIDDGIVVGDTVRVVFIITSDGAQKIIELSRLTGTLEENPNPIHQNNQSPGSSTPNENQGDEFNQNTNGNSNENEDNKNSNNNHQENGNDNERGNQQNSDDDQSSNDGGGDNEGDNDHSDENSLVEPGVNLNEWKI